MAKTTGTSKKPLTKKTLVKRATTSSRSATSKASVRRSVSKNPPVKPQSFKLAKETQPFTSFKITEQTVYWLVFTGVVLFFGLWILNINLQVQELYDQIDQNQISQIEIDEKYNKIRADKPIEE